MNDLKANESAFVIDCWKFCLKVLIQENIMLFVNQLIRSSSLLVLIRVYGQRAKSTNDFINKLKIVEESVDGEYLLFGNLQ